MAGRRFETTRRGVLRGVGAAGALSPLPSPERTAETVETGASGPGLGVLAALSGLGGAAWWAGGGETDDAE